MKLKVFAFLMALSGMLVAESDEAIKPPKPECRHEWFPKKEWVEKPSPYSSPYAKRGGKLAIWGSAVPKSLNALLDNNSFSSQVFYMMYETLLGRDPITADYAPNVASEWCVSPCCGNAFIFKIDPAAKWSDGTPITAHDVLWSFNAIMDPKHLTGPYKIGLATFLETPPVVLDERTIKFTAAESHWRNLGAIGGFPILPKHCFEGKDFNKINFDFPVVSGPYQLAGMKENISLTMKRRDDWWQSNRPANKNLFNFDFIEYRFHTDRENAWEVFRKGGFDLYPIYSARIWVQEIKGERFDKNWIVAKAINNNKPIGFQGFAMNMRREPYNDVKVRKALAHLLDRPTMNSTMMYGQYFLHKSYYEDLYDENTPCPNSGYDYNPEKAIQLLNEAGWKINPNTGWLEKNGKQFVITFLSNDSGTTDKFIALYRSDLEKVGIQLKIERKDWSAWSRDMDSYNFEMSWCAWGAGLFKDPEGMWSSKHATINGGVNITGFANARVDELIEEQKTCFDLARRNEICREIDGVVANECPYILLWNTASTRLLWWNKFGVPEKILSKYGSEDDAIAYWWYDEDRAEALEQAQLNGAVLPLPFVEN